MGGNWQEIEESNAQYIGAWSTFAHGAAHGEVSRFDGVIAMYSRVPPMFLNAIGFTSRVESKADLEARLDASLQYARAGGYPFFVSACREMLSPDAQASADAVFIARGLQPFMAWTGMATNEILPPRRQTPELDIRDVEDTAARQAVYDINCVAYGMPLEPGRDSMNGEQLWAPMFGSLGYVDGVPVATATAFRVGDCRYVALVATLPDFRNRGYAEACMRHALAKAGSGRSILHATEAGRPVYQKMGYYDVCHFTMYGEIHQ